MTLEYDFGEYEVPDKEFLDYIINNSFEGWRDLTKRERKVLRKLVKNLISEDYFVEQFLEEFVEDFTNEYEDEALKEIDPERAKREHEEWEDQK